MIDRETFVLESHEGNRYQLAVNKYHLTGDRTSGGIGNKRLFGAPVTLVLAHALGLHKETWEPFLEELELLQIRDPRLRKNGLVTEAWSVDCPSHGDAAILNENRLRHDNAFHNSQEYARSIMTLLASREFSSPRARRLILVGHSGGACAAALVLRECIQRWSARGSPFESFVLVEVPVLATPLSSLQERSDRWMVVGGMLSQFANKRRDKWNSREEAYEWLYKRAPYSDWDPRAMRRYVEFGLRPLPTALYPDERTGLTLNCHRSFESRSFGVREETTTAGAVLEQYHSELPVHLIFGQHSPFRPPDEDIPLLSSRNGKNSFYASVTDVENVNHLLVQERPGIAARAVLATMNAHRQQEAMQFSSVL